MKMFAFKIAERRGEGQCEECAKTTEYQQLYGVVSIKDIQDGGQDIGGKRETAEHLLWEWGLGQILCMDCVRKRIKGERQCPA